MRGTMHAGRTDANATTRRSLPWWRRAMPLLGFAFLAWLLSRLDLRAIGHACANLAPGAVLSCALLFSLNLALKALRWQRMLVAQGIALPLRVAVAAFFNAQFYGQVTLGHVGELYRAEALVERGVALGEALSSSIYDRLLDVGLVTLLAASLGGLVLGRPDVAPYALAVFLAGVVALAVLVGRAPAATRATTNGASDASVRAIAVPEGGSRLWMFVTGLRTGMRALMRPAVGIEMAAWTLVAWAGYFAALVALARGLDIGASAALLVASASLAALSALLPVTVSGLGAREVIFMQALSHEGVAAERAVALSLVHLGTMTACVIVLGLGGMAWRRNQRARDPREAPATRG
jgi:hypothetical protein